MRFVLIIFTVLSILVFYSCKDSSNPEKTKMILSKDSIGKELFIESNYNSDIVLDSSLSKQEMDFIQIKRGKKTDSLVSICGCEKNVESNTLKIQIRTSFPPKSKLEEGELNNSLPPAFISEYGYDIQYRFITFLVRDSIIQNVQLFKVSTENQFKGQSKVQEDLDSYMLKLNKFNYQIANNIWGEFEVIVPSGFVMNGEGSVINGTFHCDNGGISHFSDLDSFVDQTPTSGLYINKE
ncbi:hypothetical protein [Tenacibaculum sp. SG-28]|uniref:hypothetical protein n=1 Tax=Tenacibaculum sp. SG-28 TaxID=754426 RepID=UPI000CF51D27|nr:hypothetical protein [Tenacibaculum sp. SG-28]PQJ20784.1 hypothetical protein BSU00_10935 [Tenacibaculum sp. SG-28]